ncbi:hypothetical protein BX283_7509 [Streptomyces sp. TLI_146]|nr:hypothetical protein BX283_7509 [Streptomyces sp. TLI_146]
MTNIDVIYWLTWEVPVSAAEESAPTGPGPKGPASFLAAAAALQAIEDALNTAPQPSSSAPGTAGPGPEQALASLMLLRQVREQLAGWETGLIETELRPRTRTGGCYGCRVWAGKGRPRYIRPRTQAAQGPPAQPRVPRSLQITAADLAGPNPCRPDDLAVQRRESARIRIRIRSEKGIRWVDALSSSQSDRRTARGPAVPGCGDQTAARLFAMTRSLPTPSGRRSPGSPVSVKPCRS